MFKRILHQLFHRNGVCPTGTRCLAAFIGTLLGSGWSALLFWNSFVSTGLLRYADSNLPMLSTPDAYFFLAETHDMLEHGLRFDSVTALSTVLAGLHKFVWLPPEVTGFWLPLVFALCCGLTFALWAGLFRLSPLLTGLAALAGSLMPAWTGRVQIGSLDTDGGILLLWSLCLYCAARVSLPHGRNLKNKVIYAGLFLLCAGILGWFWRSGLLLVPMAAWLWGATWNWADSPNERRVRKIAAFALPIAGGLVLVLSDSLLPGPVAQLRNGVVDAMGVVANPRDAVIFQSIAELGRMDLSAWLTGLTGQPWIGGLGLFAILCLGLRHPKETLFLSPSLIMLGLAFFSNRFLFFGMIPLALGVAMLPLTVPVLVRRYARRMLYLPKFPQIPLEFRWKGEKLPCRRPSFLHLRGSHWWQVLAVLLLVIILYQQGEQLRLSRSGDFMARGEDVIALALRDEARKTPEGIPTALFHWWDEGYFLRYRTEIPSFFDGGTQTPLPAFLAAFPMTTDNPELARRWIRFFALHKAKGTGSHKDQYGGEGFEPLVRAFGSDEKAFQELVTLFTLPEDNIDEHLQKWPRIAGLPEGLSLRHWLFPQGRVFLYQPVRFLTISPWWMAMGASPKAGPVLNHLERFASAGFAFDPTTGQAKLPDAVVQKGFTKAGGLFMPKTDAPFTAPWGADRADPLLIVPQHSPFGYLVNKPMARSLAFRLLGPSWEQIPGFRLIAVNFAHAGAWEVLP